MYNERGIFLLGPRATPRRQVDRMNPRAGLFVISWLIRDTFRQTLAEGVAWLALLVSLACILGCLTVTVEETRPLLTGKASVSLLPRQEVRALLVARFRMLWMLFDSFLQLSWSLRLAIRRAQPTASNQFFPVLAWTRVTNLPAPQGKWAS